MNTQALQRVAALGLLRIQTVLYTIGHTLLDLAVLVIHFAVSHLLDRNCGLADRDCGLADRDCGPCLPLALLVLSGVLERRAGD